MILPATATHCGKVFLVGAGPGAADLLTLKAARVLGKADVVVFDHLVGHEVMDLIHPAAERIYVGKKAGKHTLPQEDINQLLVDLARKGKQVVRLKGGDPFIFGRGGEELMALAEAGLPFEVVPGVTAASGASAYAGIPLTHREIARSCTLATGHLNNRTCELDWPSLAHRGQTVVIYMGINMLPTVSAQLIAHGLPADTPAAAIRNATRNDQRTVVSTLGELPAHVAEVGLKPPALLIIGEVVSLRAQCNWFESPHD